MDDLGWSSLKGPGSSKRVHWSLGRAARRSTLAYCSSTGRTSAKDGSAASSCGVGWRRCASSFDALLRLVVDAELIEVSGSCADILEHREALWNFLETEGLDPTNNHAERELRAFVLWRKRSYGTQSERENRFAERLMTISHTASKQGRNVLELLTGAAWRASTVAPIHRSSSFGSRPRGLRARRSFRCDREVSCSLALTHCSQATGPFEL